MNNRWLVLAGMILAGVVVFQMTSIARLNTRVVQLTAQLEGIGAAPATVLARESPAAPQVSLGALPQRVTMLEQTVADLAKASERLMERGMIPPTEERLAEMQNRFFDPSASDRDRIRAFQLLRRNGQINDGVLMQAMHWLQTTTNSSIRRDLLRNIDGVTNAALKQPLMAMLSSETDARVREELIDTMSAFADDPSVEEKMWELALTDPDGRVRREASEALTEGTITPERADKLRQRASDPNQSLDARLLAMRGLAESDTPAPEVYAEMASLAQNTTDPVLKARLFNEFDGIRDESLMLPLVNGLQDANPVVREAAADALGSFGSDERIQQWLNHIIQNDPDPRVKREAHQALEQSQRRAGGGRGGRGR